MERLSYYSEKLGRFFLVCASFDNSHSCIPVPHNFLFVLTQMKRLNAFSFWTHYIFLSDLDNFALFYVLFIFLVLKWFTVI